MLRGVGLLLRKDLLILCGSVVRRQYPFSASLPLMKRKGDGGLAAE